MTPSFVSSVLSIFYIVGAVVATAIPTELVSRATCSPCSTPFDANVGLPLRSHRTSQGLNFDCRSSTSPRRRLVSRIPPTFHPQPTKTSNIRALWCSPVHAACERTQVPESDEQRHRRHSYHVRPTTPDANGRVPKLQSQHLRP